MTSIGSFMKEQEDKELKAKKQTQEYKDNLENVGGTIALGNQFTQINYDNLFKYPIDFLHMFRYQIKLQLLIKEITDYPERKELVKQIEDTVSEIHDIIKKNSDLENGRGGGKRRTRRGKTKRLRKTRRTKN